MNKKILATKILLVDDSSETRVISEALLKGLGYENTSCFANGLEAYLELLQAADEGNPYKLIISDWEMPDVDGLNLLSKIRNHPQLKTTLFIMASVNSDPSQVKMALDSGATDYFIKPLVKANVQEKLEDILIRNNYVQNNEKLLQAITEDHEFLKAILNSMNDYLAIASSDGKLLKCNDKLSQFIGIKTSKLFGYPIEKIFKYSYGSTHEFLDEESKGTSTFNEPTYIIGKEKNIPVFISCSISVNPKDRSKSYILCAKDIEREKSLNEKLVQSKKWIGLGEMAAGIAHEINNPLAIISGYAENLEIMMKQDQESQIDKETVKEVTAPILQASDRISKIIRALRSFASDKKIEAKTKSSLKEILDLSLEMTSRKMKNNDINLNLNMLNSDEAFFCRPIAISQALINLMMNAMDATKNLEERTITIEGQKSFDGLRISVINSGPKLEPVVEEKMMQPFFTTKEMGEGMGLGLSIAKKLVDEHDGELSYDSEHSQTCFTIKIPKRGLKK